LAISLILLADITNLIYTPYKCSVADNSTCQALVSASAFMMPNAKFERQQKNDTKRTFT
jgi:hypothetical protein